MPAIGWKLEPAEGVQLLERFPPEWPDIIADHVTLNARPGRDEPLPEATSPQIVGGISDDEGLQAMIVAIGGAPIGPMAALSTSPGRWTESAAGDLSRAIG